jgi:sugar lactone lactonase YvrE
LTEAIRDPSDCVAVHKINAVRIFDAPVACAADLDVQRNPDVKIGRYGIGVLMALSLAACGGGGGGGGGSGSGSGGGGGSGGSANYSIGGSITGLSASGLVLADNGGDNLPVSSGATSFTFSNQLASGAAYSVTVATQPTGEMCTVASATGTAMANVTSVAVSCSPLRYTVGGTISGLSASGLVLADNGGDNLSVSSGATSFTFATPLLGGAAYDVTVATQPTGETCTVASATGTATANVTSVAVSCKALYTVGGTISGLSASGLVLTDNGGDNLSVASGATSFTFATRLTSGATYNVAVGTQPTGESCAVTSPTGTATGNVSSVGVACSVDTYTISGSLSGLTAPGLKLQDYSGGETLSVAANAAGFQFANPVPYGTNVDVTVATQPFWESCAGGAGNFSGPIIANVTSDTFACTAARATGVAVASGTTYSSPAGVAVDSSGNVYVVETGNSSILRISPSGTVTTLLNSGNGLSSPEGVAVDSSGNVYVANTGSNQILEDSGGTITTLASAFTFNQPTGVAVDSSGNVYVADAGANSIEEISHSSGTVTALGTSYVFAGPDGVAVDSAGNVYVADTASSKIVEISGSTVTTLSGTFNGPFGVAVDSAGDVYVADTNDHEIQMITAQGHVTTVAGSSATQGSCTASPPLFKGPFGVAVNASGDLYVADYSANQVCELTPGP